MKCGKNSDKTLLIVIVAAVVAVLTTMAVLAVKFRWLDKLAVSHKRRRKNTPSFTCEFDEECDTPITEVVKKEVFPEEDIDE
ncbi:MAG: hypothetical protein IJZ13_07030 [Clostridia bacterium]|nr:hypothetical protein [Clostridia bacterium]